MLIDDGLPTDRTAIVRDSVDLARVNAAPPIDLHKEFWLPHNAPVVGNVADLVPHGGQRYLIEAAALVVRGVADARFLVVGDGKLDGMLRHQIKHLHLEKHVLLAGFRPDDLSLLQGFDLFVMSSVADGSMGGILDAMRAVARSSQPTLGACLRSCNRAKQGCWSRRETPPHSQTRSSHCSSTPSVVRSAASVASNGRGCISVSTGWSTRRPPCVGTWPTRPAQRTIPVRLRLIESAAVLHPKMAE